MSPDNLCTPGDPGQSIDPERTAPKPGKDDYNLVGGLVSTNTCSLRLSWAQLTGFFRQVLMEIFCDPNNIHAKDLKQFQWKKETETGILIESHNKRTELLVGKRPAIIIKRNSIQIVKFAIGNHSGRDKRGHETFSVGWVGSHTLFCKHGNGSGAEVLGEEVQKIITEYSPLFVRSYGLLRCDVTTVDAVQEIEEDKEVGVVPVTVGWALQQNWKLEKETPKIFKISLNALLNG